MNLKTKFILVSVLTLIMILGCSKNAWKSGIIEEEFIYDDASFASPHAGTIAETPEGIIAAWFGGTYERDPDCNIYISRKVNGDWTEPLVVADGIQNDTLRYPTWNPVLFQVPEGDLLLYYKVGPNPRDWWGMLKRSKDHGKTWGDAEKLPDGILGPIKNKPVLLKNGILLSGSSTEDEDNGWRVHFEVSSDSGKTWRKTESLNDGHKFPAIQPTLLIHNDAKVQLLCRTKMRVIGESWSEDNGKTWTDLSASSLPHNNSGIDAVTLADGRHLLVYNHVIPPDGKYKGKRTPLNVAISEDGKKWFASLVLENIDNNENMDRYSYPAVIQSSDGLVHIVYTWRREKMKYIKVDPAMLKMNSSNEIRNEVWPGQ